MAITRLVLLPGMDGTGILFEPLLNVLPREWEPIVVRYPPDEARGYDELLEVVKAAGGSEVRKRIRSTTPRRIVPRRAVAAALSRG